MGIIITPAIWTVKEKKSKVTNLPWIQGED